MNNKTKSSCKGNRLSLLMVVFLIFPIFILSAQQGEELYLTNCAACHTIGKGRLVGPDLSGISSKRSEKWQISFIKSSKKMIDSGDPDAVAIAKEYFNILMPDYNGSDADIKAIIKYIDKTGDQPIPIVEDLLVVEKIWPGNIDTGQHYFEGSLAFRNKGASCLSCHHVSFPNAREGGLLAKDLSMSYKTSGGEAGINAIMTSPPFPSMQITYQDQSLTLQEMAHLSAYLKASAEQKQITKAAIFSDTFIIGLIILAFLMFFISLIWAKRKKESVNKSIFDRQAR